jgi:hypothetical protein
MCDGCLVCRVPDQRKEAVIVLASGAVRISVEFAVKRQRRQGRGLHNPCGRGFIPRPATISEAPNFFMPNSDWASAVLLT